MVARECQADVLRWCVVVGGVAAAGPGWKRLVKAVGCFDALTSLHRTILPPTIAASSLARHLQRSCLASRWRELDGRWLTHSTYGYDILPSPMLYAQSCTRILRRRPTNARPRWLVRYRQIQVRHDRRYIYRTDRPQHQLHHRFGCMQPTHEEVGCSRCPYYSGHPYAAAAPIVCYKASPASLCSDIHLAPSTRSDPEKDTPTVQSSLLHFPVDVSATCTCIGQSSRRVTNSRAVRGHQQSRKLRSTAPNQVRSQLIFRYPSL